MEDGRRQQAFQKALTLKYRCLHRDHDDDLGHCCKGQTQFPSYPPPYSRPVLLPQTSGDLSRDPGETKRGPPWLPGAGQGLPVCFSLVSEKPKLASLLFLLSGASKLYLRKRLLCSGDRILSWGVAVGGGVGEGKWSLTNWFNSGNHVTSHHIIAHPSLSKATVSIPKYLAKQEA